MTRRATAVVPVKRLDLAKSRLALADEHRRDLALAFALDTVAALAASTRVAAVVVVTGDAVVAQQVEALGARVVPDRGRDLVASVRTGTRAARQADPHAWVVVVPGDLPCLRAADVDRVVDAAAALAPRTGAFVADRAGTGTTIVLQAPGGATATAYGPASAAGHRGLALTSLDDVPAAVRLDVDTVEDLRDAVRHGVGPATAAALAASGLPDPARQASAS